MKRKILLLLGGFFIFQLVISCCRDAKEFIDFTKIELIVEQEGVITNDSLSIIVFPEDFRYVAGSFSNFGFNNTMAFSCEEGWGGMKFPVQSVEITSNKDFDKDHLAGTSLNDLFMQFGPDENFKYTFQMIEAEGFMDSGGTDLKLFIAPSLDKTHEFTLTFSKSDGTVISGTTDAIEWE